jgi:hypothetical protein
MWLHIIIIFILINIYQSISAIQGNWRSTDEFTAESQTDIFLNIDGVIKKNCRFILNKSEESKILDGDIYFVNYNPFTLFLFGCSGWARMQGFDGVFPEWVQFHFDPVAAYLRIWKDEVLGEFVKFE